MRLFEGLGKCARVGMHAIIFAASLFAFCETTRASFIITNTSYSSGLNDVVVFYAQNDGTGNQLGTTGLKSMSVTLSSLTPNDPLIFDFSRDIDQDGFNDVNVLGSGMPYPASSGATMPTGSYIRLNTLIGNNNVPAIDGTYNTSGNWVVGGVSPIPYTNGGGSFSSTGAPNGTVEATTAQVDANYTNLYSFNLQTADTSGNITATSPTPIAVALVASGAEVEISGFLAAESGPATSIGATYAIAVAPEPSVVCLLGISTVFLALSRRRRNHLAASTFGNNG